MADQADPTAGREFLEEPGQVVPCYESTPPLLVRISDRVRVDNLSRPVEGDNDRVGRYCLQRHEGVVDAEPFGDRSISRIITAVYEEDDGPPDGHRRQVRRIAHGQATS